MFRFILVAALLAFAASSPVPEAKPKAKAQYYVDPYATSLGAVAPIAYSAPLSYADYVVPSVYTSGYAYSPYLAAQPVVVY